ncbi:MAG: HEAT repeat domain-containing protein [Acidobacteriota bacterium]
MAFIIFLLLAGAVYLWWSKRNSQLNHNEKLYLKRRGYASEEEIGIGSSVTQESRIFSAIESLNDLSPASRQRAAEDIAEMCRQGARDSLVYPALLEALNDSDANVRSAVAEALATVGDARASEALQTRLEIEEALQTRAALQKAITKLQRSTNIE